MPTNVNVTIKTDEGTPRPDEMRTVMLALLNAGLLPATGLKMSYVAATPADAAYLEEAISQALEDRPWVIDAEIETKTKEGVRRKLEKATPIERYINALTDADDERPANSLDR